MQDDIKPLLDFAASITPALAGGIVRYLHDTSKKGGEIQWRILSMQLIIAGVVGYWVSAGLPEMAFFAERPALQGSVVGISSFLAPNILDLILDTFPGLAKKYLNNKVK